MQIKKKLNLAKVIEADGWQTNLLTGDCVLINSCDTLKKQLSSESTLCEVLVQVAWPHPKYADAPQEDHCTL